MCCLFNSISTISSTVEEVPPGPAPARDNCKIAKHILMATVAAVALAVFLTAAPLFVTCAYFMISITLVSKGLALLGAAAVSLIFAGVMGCSVHKHSVKAHNLLNPT